MTLLFMMIMSFSEAAFSKIIHYKIYESTLQKSNEGCPFSIVTSKTRVYKQFINQNEASVQLTQYLPR